MLTIPIILSQLSEVWAHFLGIAVGFSATRQFLDICYKKTVKIETILNSFFKKKASHFINDFRSQWVSPIGG